MKVAYYKRLRLLLTLCSGTVAALMGLIKAVRRHPNFYLLCLSVCKNRSILVLSSGSPRMRDYAAQQPRSRQHLQQRLQQI